MNQTLEVLLVHDNDEIVGQIESNGDQLFVLECLAIIVANIADKVGVPPLEVAADLHALIARREKEGLG